MKNSDQPAFPIVIEGTEEDINVDDGLTKREYFAALAMQGVLANSSNDDLSPSWIKERLGLSKEAPLEYPKHFMQMMSIYAVTAADALLAELEKPTNQ
jgi:hypothetical protein